MAFFRNKTVNLLNLHYGIHQIAMSGGGAFFAVYLLKAGVPVALALVALAAILFGRFAIRPLIIPLAIRFGLRAMVIAGCLVTALQYPLLAEVSGIGTALYALVAMTALGDTIYWSTYHAYFAAQGDAEHRGHQLGAREALSALVGIASPLIGGWLLVAAGPRAAFGAAAIVTALSAVPLVWASDVRVRPRAPGVLKAARLGIGLFIADGWIAAGYVFCWNMALFLSLGENFLAFGGALAIAALAGAVLSPFLGRHIDDGHGRRAVWYAFGTVACVIALRAAATGDPTLAVIANALGALAGCLYVPTAMTAVYNEAKRSPCVVRFHVATEGGWDIGGSAGLLTAALLVALGAPLWSGVLLSLGGALLSFLLLRKYYARNPTQAAVSASELTPTLP